jgi:hypothetical protein
MTSQSSEDVAFQLLGWSKDEGGVSLQSRAAADTVNDNLDAFRRAVDILSSQKGQLSFVAAGVEGSCSENGGALMDSLLVVKGYCRLIKCSLSAAASTVDLSKDAVDLIKNLGNKLNAALREQLQEMDKKKKKEKSTTNYPGDVVKKKSSLRNKVVLFYFKFLEDTVYGHTKKQMRLLGPTYRGVCDVAASFISLLQAEKRQMDAFVTTFLPSIGWDGLSSIHNDATKLIKVWIEANGFFERSIQHLLSLQDTHLNKMHQLLPVNNQSLPSPDNSSTETITRVATFLLARISSLVFIMKELDQHTKSTNVIATCAEDTNSNANNHDSNDLMRSITARVVKISRLSLVAKSNLDQCTDKERAFLEAIIGLGSKAANSLGKTFCRELELAKGESINVGLKCLLESSEVEVDNNSIDVALEASGKLNLMSVILGKLFASNQIAKVRIDSMITFCETMLFEEVPKCYQILASSSNPYNRQANEVVRNFVDTLESATHFITEKPHDNNDNPPQPSKEMMHQHHELLRWMHISESHPLSNELLLRAVQRRILSSCLASSEDWKHDASNLIALMCQLMFHKETSTSHRRNISILLVRLLSAATANCRASELAKSLTIEILWRECGEANIFHRSISLISSNGNRRMRKRKRSQNKPDDVLFLSLDIQSICHVLEALASASCEVQLNIDSDVQKKTKSLWEEILNRCEGSHSQEHDCTKLLLLSVSVGLLRGHSAVAEFLRLVGMKECSSTFFIEKTLSYIELYVGNATRDKIYNAMALDLCSSLLDAALTLTEDGLTENLVIRVVNIVKYISTFAVKQTSIEAVCLQHSVVAFVCNVGTRFHSGVSDKVIQVRLLCYFALFPFCFSSLTTIQLPLITQSLAESISCILQKSSWYHISPNLSCLECFIKQYPLHLTHLLPSSTPTSVKSLLASRVQGQVFSIVEDKVIDDESLYARYSLTDESCFLQQRCSNARQNIMGESCFGSKNVTSCPRCGFCLLSKTKVLK